MEAKAQSEGSTPCAFLGGGESISESTVEGGDGKATNAGVRWLIRQIRDKEKEETTMLGRSVNGLAALVLLAMLATAVSTCAPAETPVPPVVEGTPTVPAPTPSPAPPTPTSIPPRTELTIAADGLPRSLDPTTTALTEARNVFGHIWDPLLHRKADGAVVPVLADSWERTSDTTWLLHLHPGVSFSNGEPVDAEAVKFTLERYRDPEIHQRASWYEGWEMSVVDALTVQITTPVLDAMLLDKLADAVYIVPPEYFQEVGQEGFSENPVGSGPYLFEEWVRGDHLTLVAKDDYWRGVPQIKTVVFRDMPEGSTRVAALLAGEADIAISVPVPQIDMVEADANAMVVTVPSTQSWYVGLQLTTAEPLKDVRVRQALNYAVDKEAIIDTILDGYGTVIGQAIPPNYVGYNPPANAGPYPYDPEKAKDLLAQAGYADGFTLDLDIPATGLGPMKETGEAITGYWEAIGVRVNIHLWEWGSFVDRMFGQQLGQSYTLFIRSASMTAAELFLATVVCDAGFNWNHYCNEELDALVGEATSTFDSDVQLAAYAKAEGFMHDDAPWVFLFVPDVIYGIRKDLDWSPRSDERIFAFEDVGAR